jgi:hypothetical protein
MVEVDDKGQAVEQPWAKIGILYIRKSAFERGAAVAAGATGDCRRGRNQVAPASD